MGLDSGKASPRHFRQEANGCTGEWKFSIAEVDGAKPLDASGLYNQTVLAINKMGNRSARDGTGNLFRFFFGKQFLDQQQAEIKRGAGAAGGQEAPVGDHFLVGQNMGQFRCHGEVGRVAPAGEEAGVVQERGGGADGGQPASGGVLVPHEGLHARVATEEGGAGTAGQQQAVKVGRARRSERSEGGGGVEGEAVAAGDVDAVTERGEGDLRAGPAQQVDRGDGLNFLKALREDCQDCGHALSEARMHPKADGNFAGQHLVVFGCGYVGSELARQALARGLRVTALTRNALRAEELRAAGLTTIVADLASDDWHAALAGRADFVLNAVSAGGGGLEGYRQSYLAGMKSVLAWSLTHGSVGTLAYTSSTSVYPQDGGGCVDELAPISGRDERAAVLVETEELLRPSRVGEGSGPTAAGTAGLRSFILRLAGIYGPGRHSLIAQVRAGEVTGSGGHRLNLIHRDDICAAIWAVFGAEGLPDGGVFNVADDAPATKAEVAAWLAGQLGVPVPRFTGVPAGTRRAVTPDRIIVNTRLKAVLGWAPRYPSFREGYANLLSC